MRTFVGTSGYSYKEWKGKFYPAGLPDREMLRHYAEHFRTVEINNTFYRMPSAKMIETWCAQVPEDFRFVIKASRRITHQGRIKPESVADPLRFLFEALGSLGPRLGPLLFQLPPFQRRDVERLRGFLELLPAGFRAAMEFRHVSWFDDEVYDTLRSRNVALCHSDGELEADIPFVSTADWGYLRLRGIDYGDDRLATWVDRVAAQPWSEAWVFFKHEDEATGPRLAADFLAKKEAGP